MPATTTTTTQKGATTMPLVTVKVHEDCVHCDYWAAVAAARVETLDLLDWSAGYGRHGADVRVYSA